MSHTNGIIIGIDVGGEQKGFHAVAFNGEKLASIKDGPDPAQIVDWCMCHEAEVVAVDAPCLWSKSGSSRFVERELGKYGIGCFATPSRDRALKSNFHKWVLNGERLYQSLANQYPLFVGERSDGHTCIETFPHAAVCAMAGQVIAARPKASVRRTILQNRGYDVGSLSNIDFGGTRGLFTFSHSPSAQDQRNIV